MSNYMTTPEAAKALNRSTKTLYGWVARGNGPVQPEKGPGNRLQWPANRLRWPAKTTNKLVAKGFLDRPSTQPY